MKTLLETVSSTFTGREAQILVTGYFPILSHESEPLRASLLLAVHGISFTSQLAFHDIVLDKIVSLCLQFWNDSTAFLRQAVLEHGDSRVAFVSAPFTEQNAVFASAPWLWGVNADLSAQDEVIAGRRAACNARYPLIDVVDREACYRASAGHPNGTGAQQFANAILAAV